MLGAIRFRLIVDFPSYSRQNGVRQYVSCGVDKDSVNCLILILVPTFFIGPCLLKFNLLARHCLFCNNEFATNISKTRCPRLARTSLARVPETVQKLWARSLIKHLINSSVWRSIVIYNDNVDVTQRPGLLTSKG